MSNDPNNRGPGGWPPPPPGAPYASPTPYGTAPQQPQPVAQYPAPQPYPQQQPQYAQPPNPYPQQPYGYPHPQQPIQVVVQNQIQPYGYAPQQYAYPHAGLKKDTAVLLCLLGFFFGINGLHRFYLRQTGLGILWLLTGGLCVVGQIVDAIQLLSMSQQEFDRRYNYPQLP
jgi:hypothetical protein